MAGSHRAAGRHPGSEGADPRKKRGVGAGGVRVGVEGRQEPGGQIRDGPQDRGQKDRRHHDAEQSQDPAEDNADDRADPGLEDAAAGPGKEPASGAVGPIHGPGQLAWIAEPGEGLAGRALLVQPFGLYCRNRVDQVVEQFAPDLFPVTSRQLQSGVHATEVLMGLRPEVGPGGPGNRAPSVALDSAVDPDGDREESQQEQQVKHGPASPWPASSPRRRTPTPIRAPRACPCQPQ